MYITNINVNILTLSSYHYKVAPRVREYTVYGQFDNCLCHLLNINHCSLSFRYSNLASRPPFVFTGPNRLGGKIIFVALPNNRPNETGPKVLLSID